MHVFGPTLIAYCCARFSSLLKTRGLQHFLEPSFICWLAGARAQVEGACRLSSTAGEGGVPLHLPPRPAAPPSHLLASSSGMLSLVFAVEPTAQARGHAIDPAAQAHSHAQGDAAATDTSSPRASNAPAAAAASRAAAVVHLLKARSALGRAAHAPPPPLLVVEATGGVQQALQVLHVLGVLHRRSMCCAWVQHMSAACVLRGCCMGAARLSVGGAAMELGHVCSKST